MNYHGVYPAETKITLKHLNSFTRLLPFCFDMKIVAVERFENFTEDWAFLPVLCPHGWGWHVSWRNPHRRPSHHSSPAWRRWKPVKDLEWCTTQSIFDLWLVLDLDLDDDDDIWWWWWWRRRRRRRLDRIDRIDDLCSPLCFFWFFRAWNHMRRVLSKQWTRPLTPPWLLKHPR